MVSVPGGNNIRALRTERDWSQEDLAEKIGVHFTMIAKLERSQRRLTLEYINKFAAAFGVPPSAITRDAAGQNPTVRTIPLAGKIAAGNWKEAISDPSGYVATTFGGPNSFALQPDGDSMNLVVPEGGWVVVDPDQFELREGKIFAVKNEENDTTFKRFRSEPPRLEPCSTNPVHKPILLGREPFTVIGRVVEQGSPL